ncbi:MAG: dihydrodipicolinate synthase family protein [Pirellulaceae bacterium]|nr:dihydrodipicolinate synthase family protein [Pirellulaceae bacterium]
MDTQPITAARLAESVISVPPLARKPDLTIDREENRRLVQYLEADGVSTLLYGGNAILYHVRPSEYASLLETLVEVSAADTLVIPSVGPAFGTMMDQADVLADFDFPTVMILPQREIADATGIARGVRLFAEKYGRPIVLYLKHDRWLDPATVGKLHKDGLISWVKYAVVRDNPSQDDYLTEVLQQVPGEIVVSGIGEQPAIIHMRDFGVGSFTSGCVCVAPGRSTELLNAVKAGQYAQADTLREQFLPLEDLRNNIQPIRVLHRAVELAGIAKTGPLLPMLGELNSVDESAIAIAAKQLYQWNQRKSSSALPA